MALTPQARKVITEQLKEKHLPIFKALNIKNPEFIPKMAHYQKGLTGLQMGFFESELAKGVDIYTEKVDKVLESEDPNRILYKWRYNPHYKEEYAFVENETTGIKRYFIPVDELEEIYLNTERIEETKEEQFLDSEIILAKDMTIKDYAAIHLKIPVSDKEWLNNIILNSNKKVKNGK